MFMMVKSMSNYFVPNIKVIDFEDWDENSFLLWVMHADKVPPHIGISIDGQFFSLKANGKDENKSLNSLVELVWKKSIKTIGFYLDLKIDLAFIQRVYAGYDKTISNSVTCLNPIKEILNCTSASKLTDLLTLLYAENRIKSVVGIGVDDNFKGIPNYNLEDIHGRLRKLESE